MHKIFYRLLLVSFFNDVKKESQFLIVVKIFKYLFYLRSIYI